MANIKSAKKRIKVTASKTLRNLMIKTALKTTIKKYKAAVAAGDKDGAYSAFRLAVKRVDQAASKGILHKNNAARKKSQYARMYNAM